MWMWVDLSRESFDSFQQFCKGVPASKLITTIESENREQISNGMRMVAWPVNVILDLYIELVSLALLKEMGGHMTLPAPGYL